MSPTSTPLRHPWACLLGGFGNATGTSERKRAVPGIVEGSERRTHARFRGCEDRGPRLAGQSSLREYGQAGKPKWGRAMVRFTRNRAPSEKLAPSRTRRRGDPWRQFLLALAAITMPGSRRGAATFLGGANPGRDKSGDVVSQLVANRRANRHKPVGFLPAALKLSGGTPGPDQTGAAVRRGPEGQAARNVPTQTGPREGRT